VQPFIQRASMASGETVNVSVLDGDEVVYVARSNSPRIVSVGYHAGARAPAHTVTPGVVILATLDHDALDRWIAGHPFTAVSAHTLTDAARFRATVLEARTRGYCLIEQQLDAGLRGIAVALKNRHGECKGAVSMTLPIHPLTREETIERMLPLLLEVVQALRPLI
jgi:IclR family pca regulon transcriptional regulator